MVNIFNELSLPNIYWDWNQNFSLFEWQNDELSDCMKAAWIPDPFIENQTNNSATNIFVFPNPAAEFIFINIANPSATVNINVYDASGKALINQNYLTDKIILPIHGWATGVYFITCDYGNGSVENTKFFIH